MKKLTILALAVLALTVTVHAEDEREHGVIKPMDGAQLEASDVSKVENYATHEFKVRNDSSVDTVEKSGRYYKLRYFFFTGEGRQVDRSISQAEIQENYKQEALSKGGEIKYERSGRLVFTLKRDDGGYTWADVRAYTGRFELFIIDEAPLTDSLRFGAEEMQAALDNDGRVAVYGINFDTDKDTLKPGAEEVIVEIVKLLQNNESLQLEIQGHTDNTGGADHNLDLSERRAATVKRFLLLYGIDDSRLTTKGYGMTQPIADNSTEEGRAENRRVELVKR